jgi:hypothetical protein
VIGAVLCVAAAVLTAIGAFQDLVVIEGSGGPQDAIVFITLWEPRVEIDGVTQPDATFGVQSIPQNGVPVMFVVALLFAAALLGTLTQARPSTRWFGLTTVVAASFLTAAVVMLVPQVLWWQEIFQPTPNVPEGVEVEEIATGVGPALWTLMAGAALAIAAAVVAWRRPRVEVAREEREEPDTPPMGVPVVVRRLPDEPQDQP